MLLMYMLLDGIQVCVSFGTSMTVFGCVGDVGCLCDVLVPHTRDHDILMSDMPKFVWHDLLKL